MSYGYDNSHPLDKGGLTITSFSSINQLNSQGNDDLQFTSHSSFHSEVNTDEIVNASDISATGYNNQSGYGLVNAGTAVGKAIGDNGFTDVPDLGGNEWGADLVQAPEVWDKGHTGKGVIVAVLDTGVDYNHSDLNDNIWRNTTEIAGNGIDDDGNGYVDDVFGWNFHDDNNDVLDRNGHGTHVAGTIAGERNDFGVTGIAYDAQIMSVKVLNDSGSGYYSSISDGIRYAVDNGANVINLSLGGRFPTRRVESAIEYASSKGVTVVMAAGNYGESQPGYPGRYADKSGIVVGAVDRNNTMADFSNRAGSHNLAYVTAPGVSVYSTVPNNGYDSYSGTSMASPHVAGVVALMLSANPELTTTQIRQIITETSGNNTQAATTMSWDFSGDLSQNIVNNGNTSAVSPQNFNFSEVDDSLFSNSTDNDQFWNYEKNMIQYSSEYPVAAPREYDQFSFSDNNNDNDLASIIKRITRQLQPYQRWLRLLF
ncbi:MAG: S8 family peptidase [Calothrix sp. MO_192.B10]|nr:S8 family peptidase [Calothrix sp. MO_192.B10]